MNPPPVLTPAFPAKDPDKALNVLCHLSSLIGVGFILPLIVYLIKKDEAGSAAAHAKEVLNFHLSLLIYVCVAALLCFILIGIPLLFALGLGALILAIVAAVKAGDGILYRYPLCIRFIS